MISSFRPVRCPEKGHGGPIYLPSSQAVGGNEADKVGKPKNMSSGAEMQVLGVKSRVVYMLYTL